MSSADDRAATIAPVGGATVFSVDGLRVVYGKATAVRDVSLELTGGAVTALVGPNGAGKSSALLAMYGSVPATGRVLLDGRPVDGAPVRARARAGLALVPQGRQLFPRLTVRENLQIMADLLGVGPERVDAEIERFPILATRSRALAGVLSGGEQQMLAVARALLGRPRVLLLDELVTGLAPVVVNSLLETMVDLTREGVAVLLAMPSLGAAGPVVDRGYVLVRGELAAADVRGGAALDDAYRAALGMG
ncbi:hypothetical protein PSU4_01810 [Pseudonocardia sulfidoxydans NBRC 16205]|uniref:ABC transporter domain-containing protein n=1 Tax=Pseudonocardia sulfidoxydans NBRC 16205 TaxID=1223511 RepID=A0A511D9F2_9PSEU|nr:ATP-binding cassette domain-containing protein [Pseudonocardia sulfidoxydans]GEL21227.1 hypothetical protein PSU4_01810 [Pseudonocardia sulfidoxydans NBRC 16205]